ncbi:aminodeoxychorismate/anthranilate synthase component II [Thermoactinomyces sp. DSM 45892]|uniref:anthranilate synthase component II n=1 Tax=Thermoactinomyces sp. DSM 45892 TaxID=1882753 RepID=UPI00089C95B3|nr:aminodeoxychorismate/anthranilate synthase component II [Thermoactinomyces sp. DSM 45892]SDY94550.1 anthranilate synthase, component II /aminodeoxychorismate synthase, glutamine amidotransferase subunit [Thermoactinomyces sp. DSM 45892]
MICMIDNYDSFTYNLVQYFGDLGEVLWVVRNDQVTIEELEERSLSAIIISPGPGSPEEAGISMEVIRTFAGKIPILGVCLGHQAIAEVFGGNVVRAKRPMHGKVSEIFHDGKGVFSHLPNPIIATRYHSLMVARHALPMDLEITAETLEKEIMGIRHRTFAIEGVQFHPESILSESGKQMLANFLQTYVK